MGLVRRKLGAPLPPFLREKAPGCRIICSGARSGASTIPGKVSTPRRDPQASSIAHHRSESKLFVSTDTTLGLPKSGRFASLASAGHHRVRLVPGGTRRRGVRMEVRTAHMVTRSAIPPTRNALSAPFDSPTSYAHRTRRLRNGGAYRRRHLRCTLPSARAASSASTGAKGFCGSWKRREFLQGTAFP